MAEYIEREHLARLLTEDIEFFGEENSSAKPIAYGTVMGLNTALRYVNGVGAADVVEVRHGEWIEHTEIGAMNDHLNCSVCGWKTVFCVMGKREYKYCPNCGAKMDGKDGAE